MSNDKEVVVEEDGMDSIYADLPDDIWRRGGDAA